MSSEKWETVMLGDNCLKIGSGATPRGGQENYKTEGISLIRSQNVLDFTFSKNGLAFIDDQQAKELSNVEISENDILLNITGDSVARVCQVPKDVLPARVNQHVAIIRPKQEVLNAAFLKYYLLSPKTKDFLLGLSSSGATRNALTKVMIENLEIIAPDITTQRRIASILTALDDKIELNRRMNETLEGIAQALWGEWFGKYVEGEELPEGWKWGKLEQLVDLKNGKKSPERSDSYLFNVFGSNGVIGKSNTFNSEEDTIIIGRVGSYCGSLYFSKEPCWVTDNAIIAKGKIHKSDLFIFVLLNRIDLNNHKTGSGQPLINQNILGSINIVIPPKTLIQKFDISAQPLFSKIEKNKIQSDMLAAMRDSLLPRLMRGEIEL
jgi:type I restriction enzyme S subunit